MKNILFDEKPPKIDPKALNLRGCQILAAAILLRCAEDYYNVCDKPLCTIVSTCDAKLASNTLMTREMIERFIDSVLFDAISDIPADVFRAKIKKLKKAGGKFPTIYSSTTVSSQSKGAQMPMMNSSGKARPKHF